MTQYFNLDECMTFGIELEFMAVYPPHFFHDIVREGDTSDAITALSRAFIDAGVPSCGHESLEDDEDIFMDGDNYTKWSVKDEGGLELSDRERAVMIEHELNAENIVQAIEISSRRFTFAENWQAEIKAVLSVFEHFRQLGVHFITNSSTGFHLHIGFGAARMKIGTVKNVFQLCTAFEDRLDSLYTTQRIDENAAHTKLGHFNAGLAWHFQNNKKTDFGSNIFHWLVSIEEATTYESLGNFFRNLVQNDNPYREGEKFEFTVNSHYSTLNLDNLYPNDMRDEPTYTLEFRQHAGTLDFDEICAQIELKRSLVRFCHVAKDIDFLQLCSQVSNPYFGLIEFIQGIGGSPHLISYYQNRSKPFIWGALEGRWIRATNALASGSLDGLANLEAINLIEKYESSNLTAVYAKIVSKHQNGAYADFTTTPLDIAEEYKKFVDCNAQFVDDEDQLSNMARTMIFQQLNGSDSS